MKKINKLFLIIITLGLIFLTGCSKLTVLQKYLYDDSNYIFGNKAYNEEIEMIEIDWIVGNINIIQSQNHELIIREEIDLEIADNYKMHHKLENKKLDIKFAGNNNLLDYSYKTKNLYVFLPTVINEIKINNVSASINLDYVNINNLTINNVSGDIEIYTCKLNDLEISNVSGEIIIFDDEIEDIEIETVSGNIGMNLLKLPQDFDVESTSANFTFYVNETDGFSIILNTISGKLESNLQYQKEGKTYKFNNAIYEYDFDSVSGKIKIIGK